MALMAAFKRVGQIRPRSYSWKFGVSRFEGLVSHIGNPTIPPLASPVLFSQWRQSSNQLVNSNGKRLFLIDTLDLVRSLEAEGLPSKQAEAITAAVTEVLNDSLENVSVSVVSKPEMQKVSSFFFNAFIFFIKMEFSFFHAGTASLTNKLDREIHELKAHLEAAKYDLIKYCIGTLVSLSAVGLAVVRVVI
ncbi:putative Allene oxide cyclase [Hibiscus syriacus]|uniref:Allene oxide cyclase n=1 Tax=Hibiscus syriacus TaxID=106335 RepID=A0A6A2ZRQ1_HIBSY|nr:putative Allene oxide cyclase [Hibiscus syriacus]